jgi:hypothetical protein
LVIGLGRYDRLNKSVQVRRLWDIYDMNMRSSTEVECNELGCEIRYKIESFWCHSLGAVFCRRAALGSNSILTLSSMLT